MPRASPFLSRSVNSWLKLALFSCGKTYDSSAVTSLLRRAPATCDCTRRVTTAVSHVDFFAITIWYPTPTHTQILTGLIAIFAKWTWKESHWMLILVVVVAVPANLFATIMGDWCRYFVPRYPGRCQSRESTVYCSALRFMCNVPEATSSNIPKTTWLASSSRGRDTKTRTNVKNPAE